MSGALELSEDSQQPPIGPLPDRVAIWPIENGTFGIDATFTGVTGYQHAEAHEAVLRQRGVTCSFRQELDGGWTIRLGPLPRALVEQAVALFIGSR
ncbi:MAG: hypothetical protein QOH30_948 [Baekduia sp.]|jgi:hypothetical protein|nr:hypothetical protein [Baekduia sp.]